MNVRKYARRPGILASDIGDESLLFSADQETIHVLNPVAKLIWDLCDGTHTLQEIEQAIRAGFSASEDHDVLADVRQTLETFDAQGLLEQDGR
jgi:hypothetical protein